jgi:hypothetical protein
MKKDKDIKCYLCGEDAVQYFSPDTSGSKDIECEKCGMYTFTDRVFRFYVDKEIGLYYLHKQTEEKMPFCQDQKDKLSEFVKKRFDPEKHVPVKIYTKTIKAVTGKESVHIRYR